MKPEDRLELDDLRTHQRILRREMEALEKRIERLALNVAAPEPVPVETPKVMAVPEKIAEPPPLPVMASAAMPKPASNEPRTIREPILTAVPDVKPAPVSFEQKVGAFWLVRIGVVMLLTGFVFLGNYAYHHVIAKFGPLPKVLLLYMAGAALAGVGLWLERGEEKMRNFARVLIAGGLAAIYYTTYAAHFVTKLQVIASPLLGGAALLALAGGIAWFADRRKSETIALLVVLLSYYTAAINPVAGFSLFSNLLLTALAVFFLARHRWTNIPSAALVATYASFGYWRFYHTGNLVIPSQLTTADFWSQTGFLSGYWALFTVAVFLSRAEAFTQMQRTPFLTANNAAFFGLVAPTVGVVYPGAFGTFSGIFGAVLLALSLLARRVREEDRFMDGAYLAQGLALVTIGIAVKFTGYQLALALAIESAVLLEMSRFRHGLLYKIGAALVAMGAAGFAMDRFSNRALVIPLGSTLALVFAASAWRYKQSRGELAEPRFRWFPAGFVALALMMGLAVLGEWAKSTMNFGSSFAPSLALAAVVCAASLHLLRLPEIAVLGQGYLVLASFGWFASLRRDGTPTVNTVIVIAATLAVMHWWPRQRVMKLSHTTSLLLGMPYALAVISVLYVWLPPKFSEPAWMAASGGLALLVLAYGVATRAWWLAAFGQVFTVASVFAFFSHLVNAPGPWPLAFAWMPLATIALLGLQATAGTLLGKHLPASPVALLARGYRVVLSTMTFAWCLAYLPAVAQVCVIMVLALAFFTAGTLTKRPGAMLHAAAFALGGLAVIWIRKFAGGEVFIADVAGILILLAMQQWARRGKMSAPHFPADAHPVVILAGMATLWLQVTHFAARSEHGLLLTIAWSLLAFFVLGGGFLLRERLYRQLALALFGLAIGRVFVIDVWKFETIYRIVSFIALGVMLIVVSFVYNRYGERLRTLVR